MPAASCVYDFWATSDDCQMPELSDKRAKRGPEKADFFLVQKEKNKIKKITSYKKANFMRAKFILNMYVFGFYFNHALHTPHSQLHVVACVLLQDSFQ